MWPVLLLSSNHFAYQLAICKADESRTAHFPGATAPSLRQPEGDSYAQVSVCVHRLLCHITNGLHIYGDAMVQDRLAPLFRPMNEAASCTPFSRSKETPFQNAKSIRSRLMLPILKKTTPLQPRLPHSSRWAPPHSIPPNPFTPATAAARTTPSKERLLSDLGIPHASKVSPSFLHAQEPLQCRWCPRRPYHPRLCPRHCRLPHHPPQHRAKRARHAVH